VAGQLNLLPRFEPQQAGQIEPPVAGHGRLPRLPQTGHFSDTIIGKISVKQTQQANRKSSALDDSEEAATLHASIGSRGCFGFVHVHPSQIEEFPACGC
jgi:hypothetical protein